jgi:ATP-binding cassette subfamily B protein
VSALSVLTGRRTTGEREARSTPRFDDDAALPDRFGSAWVYIRSCILAWRWHFAGLSACVLGAAGCSLGTQYVLKLLVDAMAGPRTLGGPAAACIALFLAAMAGESLFWRLLGWLVCRTTVGIGVELRLELFHCLSGQSMRYFTENLSGALGQRITATAGNFGALTNTLVFRTLPPAIDALGAAVIFCTIDPRISATLVCFVVGVTAAMIRFGQLGKPLHAAYAGEAARTGGALIDTIANMWTVKAFSARAREWHRHDAQFRREAEAQRRSWMHLEKTRALHDVMLWLMAGIVLSWAAVLWSRGEASPGDVVIVFTLTFRILHSSKDLALSLVDVAQSVSFIDDTLAVIGQARSVSDRPGATTLVARGGKITFRGVSFGYGHGRSALRDIDLVVPAHQMIGIVGPSGAGKSTMLHLLQRLYDPTHGEILVDDQPIAGVTQESLRAAFAVVPQDVSLFHRSVMENIRFARPQASDEEVHAAARAAGCDSFVRQLPQGYDTVVGERGTKLSGGQRQRIGIARAFLKDAPIIVLDEATSALDTASELEIQRALARLIRGRTVVAVAHRLSTLGAFDRILVIDDGRIVEDGPADELRRRGGRFAEMWRLQVGSVPGDAFGDAA